MNDTPCERCGKSVCDHPIKGIYALTIGTTQIGVTFHLYSPERPTEEATRE